MILVLISATDRTLIMLKMSNLRLFIAPYLYSRQFHILQRVIDYLKVDIEGAEWPFIAHVIGSDVHKRIKQMALELHTPKLNVDQSPMTVTDYKEIYRGLKELERLGFRLFLYHANNNCCGRFAELTPSSVAKKRLCCYETFFVNTMFLS